MWETAGNQQGRAPMRVGHRVGPVLTRALTGRGDGRGRVVTGNGNSAPWRRAARPYLAAPDRSDGMASGGQPKRKRYVRLFNLAICMDNMDKLPAK